MKTKIALFILILSVSFLQSCVKPPIITPPDPPVIQAEDSAYVWRKAYYSDTSMLYTGQILSLIDGNRLFYRRTNMADTAVFAMFDIETKQDIWEWQDYYLDESILIEGYQISGDKVWVNSKNEQYCFETNTGSTLWKYKVPISEGDCGSASSQFGDMLFQVRYFGSVHHSYRSTLMMADISDGIWKPVFTTKHDGNDDYESNLLPPATYVDASGDTILIFQDRRYRDYEPRDYTDWYAYNLSTKTVVWKLGNISPEISNTSPAVIDEVNNRVYFVTRYTVYCHDLTSGDKIWKHTFDDRGVLGATFILHEDKLIGKSDQGYLMALDADTGSILYSVNQGGCCHSQMVRDNRIYYVDQDIWVSDVNTGQLTWRYNGYGGFSGFPVFDEEKDLMYVTGSYYLYAIEIPKY